MWFKSKTQHADPEVRRKYVEQLPADDATLLSAAVEDPHPDVRGAAVVRLDNLEALQKLAHTDPDAQIRKRAMARLQSVLAGADGATLPLPPRSEFVAACDNASLLTFVARSGVEPELRRVALQRLLAGDREELGAVLCDIAVDDPVSELRETAAKEIDKDDDLATLVQRSRGRDKSIYRHAQQRLERRRAKTDARTSIERCAEQATQLMAHDSEQELAAIETRFAALQSEWEQATGVLEDEVDAKARARFETARDACLARFAAARAIRRQREEILAALQAHADGCGTEPVPALSQRWHELGEPTAAEARQFDRLVHAAHETDSQRDREQDRTVRAEALIESATAAVENAQLQQHDIERLERQWQALPLPEDREVRQRLEAGFDSARQKLRARIDRDAVELAREVKRIDALLDSYEEALKEGQLRNALSAHDKAASALGNLVAGDTVRKPLEERLHAFEPRMTELRRWRHWGTVRARESLCTRAEELMGSALQPPAIASAVRDIRAEWKKLDKADGAASKPLWKRFDDACEKAYEPCEAYFEQQKKQRQANMGRCVAICEKLEQMGQETDWDNPPWREVADALRDAQREWQRCGPVDRRQKKKIEKRFRSAYNVIETHLQETRQSEIQRREALIANIEGIAADADLRGAIQLAKSAQRDWKPLIQADRRTERELWKRFRTACDAVFDRRKSQIEAADQERLQHLAEKKAVCDQIEQLVDEMKKVAKPASEAVGEARRQLNRLRAGWQRIGAVPRNEQREIDQRFRAACDDLTALCDHALEHAARARLESMREIARRCDGFEQALAEGEDLDPSAICAALDTCSGDATLAPLASRLERVRSAADGDAAALAQISNSLGDNLVARQQICLEMEVAANIDSPSEQQEARMAWRVNQLSASLSGARQQRDAQALQRAWFATGAVPRSEQAAIEARFERALDALGKS